MKIDWKNIGKQVLGNPSEAISSKKKDVPFTTSAKRTHSEIPIDPDSETFEEGVILPEGFTKWFYNEKRR